MCSRAEARQLGPPTAPPLPTPLCLPCLVPSRSGVRLQARRLRWRTRTATPSRGSLHSISCSVGKPSTPPRSVSSTPCQTFRRDSLSRSRCSLPALPIAVPSLRSRPVQVRGLGTDRPPKLGPARRLGARPLSSGGAQCGTPFGAGRRRSRRPGLHRGSRHRRSIC